MHHAFHDSLREKARQFRALHRPDAPLLLPNAWDVGSACVLAASGAGAIATSSAGIAFAHGIADAAGLSRDASLAVVAAIFDTLPIPVTADLEDGYGDSPEAVAETVRLAIEAGAVGGNIEDGTGDPSAPLLPAERMVEKLRAARAAANAAEVPFFINARTDGFWSGGVGPGVLRDAIARCQAYEAAGADGVFVPLLFDPGDIATLVGCVSVPVNVLAHPKGPGPSALADLGVSRISLGGAPARLALTTLGDLMHRIGRQDGFAALAEAQPHAKMQGFFAADPTKRRWPPD